MNKKEFFKKLNSQKGLTGADIAVAISVIVLTITVVTMIYLNLDNSNKSINRNAGATKLATNIMENIQLTDFEQVKEKTSTVATDLVDGKLYNTRIPNGYTVTVKVEEPSALKLVKKVSVEVKYKVGSDDKNILLNTVIEKKFEKECNVPEPTLNSLKDTAGEETKFGPITDDSNIIIIPIKYSYLKKSYVVTEEKDPEWYNYSSKDWAKILVFVNETIDGTTITKEILKDKLIDSEGNVTTESVLMKTGGTTTKNFKDYLYVWIPNYGKGQETGKTAKYYFRYGNKTGIEKNALDFKKIAPYDLPDTSKTLSGYSININVVFDNSISINKNGIWRKYKPDLKKEDNTLYSVFNFHTQYGPMIIK